MKNSQGMTVPVKFRDVYMMSSSAKSSGRNLLQGFLRYSERKPDWHPHILEPHSQGFETLIRALGAGEVDGVITSELENPELAEALESSAVPLVVIGAREGCLPKRWRSIAFVGHDEERIGSFGARYLLHLGNFRSFGFVRASASFLVQLNDLRQKGFLEFLEGEKQEGVVFDPQTDVLTDWLRKLEKPAAVMAAYDDVAVDVVNECYRLDIRIPEDIRVLGVDNNELLCLSTRPRLSSLYTDCLSEGMLAAQCLDKMLLARCPQKKRVLNLVRSGYQVAERESTSVLSPGLAVLKRAKEYISEHAGERLTPEIVAGYLGVSRNLLFLRFSQFSETSLQETIVSARIGVLKQRLRSSRQSIEEVVRKCGWSNVNSAKAIFKREVGMTMRDWRKEAGK